MKKSILLVSILTCILFAPARVLAWGAVGHRVVAAIAYQSLSNTDKATATNLLQYHSKYPAWVAGYAWDVPSREVDFGTYLFMRASTWADEIKGSGSPHDHYDWHFADYPLKSPGFPDDPRLAPGNDVIEGIVRCETSLTNWGGTASDRAAHLALLIHYVGDVHQPLHCAALVNATYPTGDRGGNDFYVLTNSSTGEAAKLHGLWDGGLGTVENMTNEFKFATGLAALRPRASYAQLVANTTVESWCKEGRNLAITNGYRFGNLRGGTNAATAQLLPADYLGRLAAVAQQQAPLAGYRLADEIHAHLVAVSYPPPVTQPVFDPNSVVAWLVGPERDFGVSPLSAATNTAHITSSGLVRGPGVGTSGTGASRAWGGNNFASTSKDAAISAGKFITFSVTPAAGCKLSCSALAKFYYRRSASGPTNGLLQYQIGAGAFTDIASLGYPSVASIGVPVQPIDLTGIAALQNVPANTTVTFRIVNWGGTASTGSWYVFDSADDTAADFALLGAVMPANPPSNPVISISPGSLNFGLVPVNSSTGLVFTVSNAGGGTLAGTATTAGSFTITQGAAYSLAAGQSQSVTIKFAPTSVGDVSGSVMFTGGGGATATVSGRGINRPPPPSNLKVSPSP